MLLLPWPFVASATVAWMSTIGEKYLHLPEDRPYRNKKSGQDARVIASGTRELSEMSQEACCRSDEDEILHRQV